MVTVEGECLGLRFRGGEGDRQMMEEEMELEEGEAYPYHNNEENNVDNKYDDRVDPDVAFSYMVSPFSWNRIRSSCAVCVLWIAGLVL